MEPLTLSPRTLVADLLALTPRMAPLFLELRVDCLGCSMNKFCTLADVCDQYELSCDTLINLIEEKVLKPESD